MLPALDHQLGDTEMNDVCIAILDPKGSFCSKELDLPHQRLLPPCTWITPIVEGVLEFVRIGTKTCPSNCRFTFHMHINNGYESVGRTLRINEEGGVAALENFLCNEFRKINKSAEKKGGGGGEGGGGGTAYEFYATVVKKLFQGSKLRKISSESSNRISSTTSGNNTRPAVSSCIVGSWEVKRRVIIICPEKHNDDDDDDDSKKDLAEALKDLANENDLEILRAGERIQVEVVRVVDTIRDVSCRQDVPIIISPSNLTSGIIAIHSTSLPPLKVYSWMKALARQQLSLHLCVVSGIPVREHAIHATTSTTSSRSSSINFLFRDPEASKNRTALLKDMMMVEEDQEEEEEGNGGTLHLMWRPLTESASSSSSSSSGGAGVRTVPSSRIFKLIPWGDSDPAAAVNSGQLQGKRTDSSIALQALSAYLRKGKKASFVSRGGGYSSYTILPRGGGKGKKGEENPDDYVWNKEPSLFLHMLRPKGCQLNKRLWPPISSKAAGQAKRADKGRPWSTDHEAAIIHHLTQICRLVPWRKTDGYIEKKTRLLSCSKNHQHHHHHQQQQQQRTRNTNKIVTSMMKKKKKKKAKTAAAAAADDDDDEGVLDSNNSKSAIIEDDGDEKEDNKGGMESIIDFNLLSRLTWQGEGGAWVEAEEKGLRQIVQESLSYCRHFDVLTKPHICSLVKSLRCLTNSSSFLSLLQRYPPPKIQQQSENHHLQGGVEKKLLPDSTPHLHHLTHHNTPTMGRASMDVGSTTTTSSTFSISNRGRGGGGHSFHHHHNHQKRLLFVRAENVLTKLADLMAGFGRMHKSAEPCKTASTIIKIEALKMRRRLHLLELPQDVRDVRSEPSGLLNDVEEKLLKEAWSGLIRLAGGERSLSATNSSSRISTHSPQPSPPLQKLRDKGGRSIKSKPLNSSSSSSKTTNRPNRNTNKRSRGGVMKSGGAVAGRDTVR